MLQVETVLKHLLETVGRMFRRVAVGFTAVFIAGIVIVEGVSSALSKQFPATGLTHVVAVVVGFSLALNVALAIAIEEGLRGFITLIREVATAAEREAVKVVHEVEKDGGAIFRAVEHEAGQFAQGAGHVVQGIERGAVTAARDVAHVPGEIIGGVEGGVQGIERRITGQGTDRNG
jgi:hypothetical protein